MAFNYIDYNDIIHVDNYEDLQVKLYSFNNIKFRTHNSNCLNFQTQLGIDSDNKIISITNKQLSYLVQKYFIFLGDDYAFELKKDYEILKNEDVNNLIIIEDDVFQFFDYESVSSTSHSFDLMFYLLKHYKSLNLNCKLLILESNNKYYNSLLDLIKRYYDIEYFVIKENSSYLFKNFKCIKTYQNVLFKDVKKFINDTLVEKIINKYDALNCQCHDNIAKLKYFNPNNTNRANQVFNNTEELQLFFKKNRIFDLNEIDDNEELKIYYINKAKNILIDWGSSYYININYYLFSPSDKYITVVFHENMMGERYNLTDINNFIKQYLPDHYYPSVPYNINVYGDFTFKGRILDNIKNTDDLLAKM